MTKKRWIVSRGSFDVSKEEAIATYKEEIASKGWEPDCEMDKFDDKEEAIAFFETQCKTLEDNENWCEIAVLTECLYKEDDLLGGEWYHEYTDLAIAIGK